MGELSNINLFGRLLDNSEMEDITLCQDYLAGDLVKKMSVKLSQLMPDLVVCRDIHFGGQRDSNFRRSE